jgi:UDP-N-acetylglucosamine acyltransferase
LRIHSTAIIDPKSELDSEVEVQAYSIIGQHVRIGCGTIVGPHCVIDGRTVIGEGNRFFSGAQIGVRCQDLKHKDEFIGRLEIGNGNVIREHATVSASTMSSDEDDCHVTTIGNHCMIMTCAHVAHDCSLGDNVIMANGVALAGHVRIESRANLGGLSAVHQFCVVGTMAMVGGMTRVWHDAPPYMTVDGNPARCCGPNTVGLKRNGLSDAARARIKAMYKIMYRSNLNKSQAMHEIEAQVEESEERACLLDFMGKSLRGITP